MAELKAYGEAVTSIFQLIGNLENDITKSIAWALSSCPVFLKSVVFDILNIEITPQDVQIIYQNFEKDKGITDLEITDNETFYVIIEAKRGWILPGAEQLKLYSEREKILKYNYKYKAIITMSECSNDYANTYLPFKECNGIAIKHISWKRLYDIASESISVSTNSQKNLLKELKTYLGGIMTMQTQESNWVFIVSLSYSNPTGCNLSFVDIVRLKKYIFIRLEKMDGLKKLQITLLSDTMVNYNPFIILKVILLQIIYITKWLKCLMLKTKSLISFMI